LLIFVDVGITIGNVLFPLSHDMKLTADEIRERNKNNIENNTSQSNGSLMRISPLAVYVSNIKSNEVIEEVVRAEVSLTHGNPIVQLSAVAYCLAIRDLINGKNRVTAYNTAKYSLTLLIGSGRK
jgi:ADP-ribosylglycohydrolase